MTPLFSAEVEKSILADRDKGLTILELARKYGCSLGAMAKLLRRHGKGGVSRGAALGRTQGVDMDRAEYLLAQGHPLKEVAAWFGVWPESLCRARGREPKRPQ